MWAKILTGLCLVLAIEGGRPNTHERLKEVMLMVSKNATLMELYNEHVQNITIAREKLLGKTKRLANTFDCASGYSISTTKPTSVHNLRPEHIGVVAAMGDSLTAGNGILGTNILQCLTEYRGRSWSIGGDLNFERVQTFPNILRKYNPYIVGASLEHSDTSNLAKSQLNVAVAGETSQEMPRQARDLLARLKDPRFGVDYQNDWKVITLFIGGNDLCDYCHNSNTHSPDNYIAKIREALDILHAEVPRAFVNLAQIFDITPLAQVSQGFFCNFVTSMVCDCAKDARNNNMLSVASLEYQRRIEDLVASGRYDTRDDFTVVLQPFFQHTQPVKTAAGAYDLAYFAPDCFHFSEPGQYAAAKSLWNNMLEPVGQKKSAWDLSAPVHCPHTYATSDGRFRTAKN